MTSQNKTRFSRTMELTALILILVLIQAFIPMQTAFAEGTEEPAADNSRVSCLSPHAACEESKMVIETLMKVSKTYSQGDFEAFSKYLDDDVTVFDDTKKKLIVGKKAVLDYVEKIWKDSHVGPNPVISYTIEHPYAKVNGDTAVVTFKAVKVIGGTKNPGKYESKSTDIFVKKHGEWKKLHYVSHWKKVKS
ncbi:MAG TPA: nuclear transport factor 2 family protein [Candidatus Melainabacteria bacterium]|nr:nuclear transport factor 2 family protein [Candidatus Melainabacteria bacterium]